jgi:hypothetical protein
VTLEDVRVHHRSGQWCSGVKHLRNLDHDAPNSWPDFPPAAIQNLVELPPFDIG